jgi:hypothetical protein
VMVGLDDRATRSHLGITRERFDFARDVVSDRVRRVDADESDLGHGRTNIDPTAKVSGNS